MLSLSKRPAMERTYQYRGDLKTTALPEMLYTIYRTRMAGVIEAKHHSVTKRVWIKEGDVIHATSTDRNDSLGAHLGRSGKVAANELLTILRQREQSHRRLGELLVERGVLSPAAIYKAIREQVEGIIWSLFTWEEGDVTFRLGDVESEDIVRIFIPMRQAIVQGVRRAPNAKTMVARLGRKETVFESTYRSEDLIAIALDEQEYQLLARVNGRRSLFDLCTAGPLSTAESGKLIYAYHVLQLIRRLEKEEAGIIKIRMRTD